MITPSTQSLPLFPTHVIGSLPRPQVVRDLIARRNEIPVADYQAQMDDMVRFAIRIQESAGIDIISDGEWRRSQYIKEFLTRIGGTEPVRPYRHQGETKFSDVITRRMETDGPLFADDAAFLVQNTSRLTKFAVPSPFLIGIRYWHEDYSRDAYPTYQDFMHHLADILRVEAEAAVAAGVDVIQVDDPALTYYCDRRLMKTGRSHDERLHRNWDIDKEVPEAVAAINRIVDGLEAEVHLHCCHSVYKRQSDVTGDYKPLLPYLSELKADRVNLEFAYRGTGSDDDLEMLPAHLGVGMGIVDVRGAKAQSAEEMEALAFEGANRIDSKRIALNPDCGFAPDAGEPPTIDEAYVKLCRLSEATGRLRERLG